jgi:Tfp pilus assembly protein PilE
VKLIQKKPLKFIEKNISGTTLLEFLIAIAIAGIAVTLIFAFYTNVVKGYWLHGKRSEAVKEMIVARLAIKRHFTNVEKVVSCRKDGFDYVKAETDSVRTVRFTQNALLDNNDTIIKNITSFSCQTQMPDEKQQGRGVLLWEAVIGKGNWVAGATAVSPGP